MNEIVSLVAHGGRQVIRTIVLHVMMLNMVVVVGIPAVSHKWICDIGEDGIQNSITLAKDTAKVYMLMHHESICAHVRRLHGQV